MRIRPGYVEIAMADSGGIDSNNNLAGPRLGIVNLNYLERLARALKPRCSQILYHVLISWKYDFLWSKVLTTGQRVPYV